MGNMGSENQNKSFVVTHSSNNQNTNKIKTKLEKKNKNKNPYAYMWIEKSKRTASEGLDEAAKSAPVIVEDLKIYNKKKKIHTREVMRHGIGLYLSLSEIKSPSSMTNFITINYLFNFIFGFIR